MAKAGKSSWSQLQSLEKEQRHKIDTRYHKLVEQYFNNPVGYANTILGVKLTPQQESILEKLTKPPNRVLVPSGNNVGKSFLAAVSLNWSFDCRGPSISISTAPTHKHVVEVLWAEVRLQRLRAEIPDYFIGPQAPYMRARADWYAMGFTASSAEAFGGRHRPRMHFVFDEATAISPDIWHRMRTMFDPSPESHHTCLAIFNPITTNCQAFIEDNLVDDSPDNPPWHRIRLSALDHPNIEAELKGLPKPIPGAVSVHMVENWIRDYCEEIERTEDLEITDFRWPIGQQCPCCKGKGFVD